MSKVSEALQQELAEARAVIAQHELCHDLHGKVDAKAFADGCAAEQRRLYGCAPDADLVQELVALLEWLNGRGGLGLDVHERIRVALVKAGRGRRKGDELR